MKSSFIFFLAAFVVWIVLVSKVQDISTWTYAAWCQVALLVFSVAKSVHFRYFNYKYKVHEGKTKFLTESVVESTE